MACIQYIYICSFFLAVIAGHILLCTEGRQLKEFNKQKFNSLENYKGRRNLGKEPIGSKQIPEGRKGERKVTGSFSSHEISVVKESLPSMSTIGPNPSPEFGSSLTAYANGFQPTTPGNSPGVGHSHVGSNQKAPSITSNVVHSLSSNPDDFRPTAPGRSPGVGHSYQNTNTEPNA